MPKRLQSPPRVAFVTLGCAKNEVDTEAMEQGLLAAGYALTDEVAASDCIVINTCAFIEDAVAEAIDAILELADGERIRDGSQRLVVSGCLPARYGDELNRELPEVAAFVPCDQESQLPAVLASLGLTPLPNPLGQPRFEMVPAAHPSYAYIKISEGCNRGCTFCTIPSIRGPYESSPLAAIIDDVTAAASRGAIEMNLIAQDTGRWGVDLTPKADLSVLINELSSRFPERWFRLLYVQPDAIDERLIKALADSTAFNHYLDIPIQHVDREILTAMGRRGSLEEMRRLGTTLRERIPAITLRTTMIVGFPGETPQAFDQLCDFVAEGLFDYVGIFPFSPEESTKAATLPDQIDEAEKLVRWQTLRDIADDVGAAAMGRHIGEDVDVLIDEVAEDGGRIGHTRFQAPEVDGVTFTPHGEVGEVVRVTIEDTLGYDLEGR